MPDTITAHVHPGDAGQRYATITLAGIRITAYRAPDADLKPTGRLVIDVDTEPDHADELAIYVNDSRVLLAPPPAPRSLAADVLDQLLADPGNHPLPGRPDGVRHNNRAVLVNETPDGAVEITLWRISNDDIHITPTPARTYRTAAAAAHFARRHLDT